jgi:hypothetical protein
MLEHPDQNVRLAVEMRDHGVARGTLWEVFPEGFGDSRSLEPLVRLRF